MTVALPAPTPRRDDPVIDVAGLRAALGRQMAGEVRFDAGSRAAYSTDASNFRQVPIGVVLPRTIDDGARAVATCARFGAPVLSRGGGTSLAGQTCNTAVVLDWSKYCNALVSVDVEHRTCVVEPGIVLDVLNRRLAEHGLRYGPEPATHYNCTLGGMIGNNSCGATAQRTGKVVDNMIGLEVLLYDGTRFWCGPTSDAEYDAIAAGTDRRARLYRELRQLRDEHLALIRTRYPTIPRRVSGYNLDCLLPEQHFNVAGALVGSESTLVTVLHAQLTLIPVVKHRTLVVLGYPSVDRAADAVPELLPHRPIALEGMDDHLIGFQRRKQMNSAALDLLPEGHGWLMAQFGADTQSEADAAARALVDQVRRHAPAPSHAFFDDPQREEELWAVREGALGASAHPPDEPDAWPGWEDAAVAPDRLGDYLRDLLKLYAEFGYSKAGLYGHFGQGCVHSRIPFALTDEAGVTRYRNFLERAADLVAGYGGSLSGEHGDGQQRGELLIRMFGPEVVDVFRRLKALFDPDNRMNPGKLVDPYPLDANLRLGSDWRPGLSSEPLHFRFPNDGGSFARAANRCVGVGKCRQHDNAGGAVMCPSYQVLKEEEHATRGRARLLFEMLDGHHDGPLTDGWRSEQVYRALDLCLACKGCKKDCPVNVDMATYKAEFLAHYWQGRLRPRADYAMGYLPAIGALIARGRLPRLVNTVTHTPGLRRAVTAAAGLEPREVPLFAGRSLQQWFAGHTPTGHGRRGPVLLWPDTFTNLFHPHIGRSAVRVLERAGWQVIMPDRPVCCGLTWISTGQLDMAERILGRTVRLLADHARRGTPIVGLEPSCTAVFRSDMTELMPQGPDISAVAEHVVTLAELLRDRTDGWQPPALRRSVLIQQHCHQHAVLGNDADLALLADMAVHTDVLESGCCGYAGNFGFQPGHLAVSEAAAERVLLPAVRAAPADTIVLADGFSCRSQIHELDSGGREALHLAELLDAALRPVIDADHPFGPPRTPPAPGRTAQTAALAATAAAATAALFTGLRALRR